MEFGMGVQLPWNHLLSLLEILEVSPERSAALNLLGFFSFLSFLLLMKYFYTFGCPHIAVMKRMRISLLIPKGNAI